jgi:hypothetical protein
MNRFDNHRVIAHALALAGRAAGMIRNYSSQAAEKIEVASEKVASNEPRAMTSFRRLVEQLQEMGEKHIEDSGAESAARDYAKWLALVSNIDKDLRRIDDSSAAKTFDRSATYDIHCSVCGELLSTPFAKQCFACSKNWH